MARRDVLGRGAWETRRREGSMSRRERTVLSLSICTTAYGIPRLEADDMMELTVLRHSLEFSATAAR